MVGAGVLEAEGFSEISGRRVGLVASRASVVGERSVIDLVADADEVELVAIFAPEHGVRAEAGAGEQVADDVDPVTGLPVFSLYGSTRRPTAEMLAGIDVLLFDLQDVGTRFYTYTATMGLAMQSAAEAGIPFVVLDRPNPLGGTVVDGPVRDDDQESFISQYPVPSAHGMTAGELALAIRGEGWLDGLGDLDLRIVELAGWDRDDRWADTGLGWVPPSPGLPTVDAAMVYPATVLFEGTSLSYGRGTDHPFQQVGAPWIDGKAMADSLNDVGLSGIRFEPVSYIPTTDPPNGPAAADPQYEGQVVSGVRLDITDRVALRPVAVGIHLMAAVLAQAELDPQAPEVISRPEFFDLLAGTAATRQLLTAGVAPEEIIESWSASLAQFEFVRSAYLLY